MPLLESGAAPLCKNHLAALHQQQVNDHQGRQRSNNESESVKY
jgi:hypothetical protein